MTTGVSAGPYVSRHVARAGNGQPTTVLYQGPTYSGPDARETARHGMGVAGIIGKPVRQVAFAWGRDNVDVAAIQENEKSPGNPWADCYSVRDGKSSRPANFCTRELEQLVQELDLAARAMSHKQNPNTRQRITGQHIIQNSYDTPLVVNRLATFPNDTDAKDYARASAEQLKIGPETGVAVVFAYGTNASGEFGPAADILAFGKKQPTPENPDADLHTIVGQKAWPAPGICRFEAQIAAEFAKNLSGGLKKGHTLANLRVVSV